MKFKSILVALLALALSCTQVLAQATILPPGMTCFQASAGINGMVGVLGTITGGASYTNGTYGGVPLTGGSGTNATANITVSGGSVTQVTVLNPGINYVVGDVLTAAAATIGGSGSGFSVTILSTSINSSLAGGSVSYLIPNTQTPKQTWQDAGETVLNQNPVILDQNGCAVIYGSGTYLMVVSDSLGNVVYSKLTAATNGSNGIFWAALAGGTGNAITVIDTNFALQDGYNLQFLALAANTAAVTIAVSGGTPIAIVKDTSTGPAPLTGGEIGPFNTPMLTYDATNVEFHIVNPSASSSSSASSSLVPPQGYLNLVGQATGDVIQTGDVISATTVFYSPFVGDTIPIWNGSTFVQTVFSELTAALTSSGSASNAIQDACVFSNNGVPTLAIAPAWTTAAAGSGNRGTGAGSAQITRLQGLWVNAVSITGYNGLSSFTIGANRCTYVGSLSIDATAGQVTAHRTYGQSRKFGVWNAYNRQPIYLIAGDSTTSWNTAVSSFRASNGNAANSLSVFMGLPEEPFATNFTQVLTLATTGASNSQQTIGIGLNQPATSATASGVTGNAFLANSTSSNSLFQPTATFLAPPSLGINTITALEKTTANNAGSVYSGTQPFMQLSAQWRG